MRLSVSRLRRDERGYTMIAVIGAIALVSILVAARAGGDQRRPRPDPQRPRPQARLRGGPGRDRRLLLPPQQRQQLLGALRLGAGARTPSTSRARPPTGGRSPGPRTASYAIELMPATGHSACDHREPGRNMLEQSGAEHRLVPHPLDRLRREARSSRSSPPSSGRASSTTSTSPSSRPLTRSPTGTRPRSPAPTRSAPSSGGRGARAPAIPNSGGQFCDVISFITGDADQGPAAHQRRPADLRHSRASDGPPPT